ncbi:MAG: tetratricopeptide repeat protein [Candidatus Omnitrophota bacterium]
MTRDRKADLRNAWLVIVVGVFAFFSVSCGGGVGTAPKIYIPDLNSGNDHDAHFRQGWKNIKGGNAREAIKNFQKSTSREEYILVGYGYAYLAQNKLEMAKTNFEKCLAMNPGNIQAQIGMANLYELLNDSRRAFLYYTKLRSEIPDNSWVTERYETIKSTETQNFLKLAERYKNENNTEAYIQALESASQYSPEMVKLNLEIADFYTSHARYKEAARKYEEFLVKMPNSEEILMKLAEAYEKAKEYDAAIMIYKKLQDQTPENKTLLRKIEELKIKFSESNLPEKFKSIFFKKNINREEMAALIGHYFDKYLPNRQPLIITDIGNSFAKQAIIKICALDIMQLRPDHSFDRFQPVNRASFAVILGALIKCLGNKGVSSAAFTPAKKIEPADISRSHKDYAIIAFLLSSEIIKLDTDRNFNPTLEVSPSEALAALHKILNGVTK